jgi:phasin family protein
MINNDMTENWNNIAKTAMNSIKELGNINVRVIEKLTEQQLAVLNTCLEASKKEIDLASKTKNPEDIINMQSELIAEYNTKLMGILQNTGAILSSCNSDITAWAEKSVTATTSKAVNPGKNK